jgi:hypothetical protein
MKDAMYFLIPSTSTLSAAAAVSRREVEGAFSAVIASVQS